MFAMPRMRIFAPRGVAIREFPLPVSVFADYLLYIDGMAAGVIEAKKAGATLSGVERQSEKYTKGMPRELPCWAMPLPFSYESTGAETRFTNGLDPNPRARSVFAFHKPELLAVLLASNVARHSNDNGGYPTGQDRLGYCLSTFLHACKLCRRSKKKTSSGTIFKAKDFRPTHFQSFSYAMSPRDATRSEFFDALYCNDRLLVRIGPI